MSDWPPAAEATCVKWQREAFKYKWVYYDVERHYRLVANVLGGLNTLLLVLTPTTSFASWMNFFSTDTRLTIAGVITTIALAVKYVSAWWKAEEYANLFKASKDRFDALINRIQTQRLAHRREEWDKFQLAIMQTFADIQANSPTPPYRTLVAHGIIAEDGTSSGSPMSNIVFADTSAQAPGVASSPSFPASTSPRIISHTSSTSPVPAFAPNTPIRVMRSFFQNREVRRAQHRQQMFDNTYSMPALQTATVWHGGSGGSNSILLTSDGGAVDPRDGGEALDQVLESRRRSRHSDTASSAEDNSRADEVVVDIKPAA